MACLTIIVAFSLVYAALDWQFKSQILMSVDADQIPDGVLMDTRTGDRIASEVQKRGIEVIHHDYDAVHAMGGGMRCSHHPIRRVVT